MILYKQNVDGSIQRWTVNVDGNIVYSHFGRVDGKTQTTSDTITGKNIGKVNETTAEEQAVLKAKQMYDRKVKQGYTPDLELARSTKNTLAAIKPMLAFDASKKEKHITFPALVQPKLDGLRCIAVVKDGKCTLYSRTQKEFKTLPHIVFQIEYWCNAFSVENIIIDGELYNHSLNQDFNRLISLIKRDEPHKDCEEVEFHAYDVVDEEKGYKERTEILQTIAANSSLNFIKSKLVESKEEIDMAFRKYIKSGYEGAMYRNPKIGYEMKRSNSLLKVKVMEDSEFLILDVIEGNGKLQGKAGSFLCRCDGGTFKAKLRGELKELKKYFVEKEKYIGKMLTVSYQGFTPAKIPRFPVGQRIRLYPDD